MPATRFIHDKAVNAAEYVFGGSSMHDDDGDGDDDDDYESENFRKFSVL